MCVDWGMGEGIRKKKIFRITDMNFVKVQDGQNDVLSSVEGGGLGRDVSVHHRLSGSHLFPPIFNFTFTFLFFCTIFGRRLAYVSAQPHTEAFKFFCIFQRKSYNLITIL